MRGSVAVRIIFTRALAENVIFVCCVIKRFCELLETLDNTIFEYWFNTPY